MLGRTGISLYSCTDVRILTRVTTRQSAILQWKVSEWARESGDSGVGSMKMEDILGGLIPSWSSVSAFSIIIHPSLFHSSLFYIYHWFFGSAFCRWSSFSSISAIWRSPGLCFRARSSPELSSLMAPVSTTDATVCPHFFLHCLTANAVCSGWSPPCSVILGFWMVTAFLDVWFWLKDGNFLLSDSVWWIIWVRVLLLVRCLWNCLWGFEPIKNWSNRNIYWFWIISVFIMHCCL